MSISDFEVLQKLGEGAYSSVYKVCRKADRLEYALKKVKISNLSDKEKENALNEVRLLASVNHPNIIAYREAFLDEPSNSLCIVMEYADDGDVFQLISAHKASKEYIPEERVWSTTLQVVLGLRELHRLKILHRDMKSANIFLTKDGRAKLGDMNVSKIAKKGLLYTQTGTPYYASPEVWREKPYNNKSDIWSLGCVLFEMCALKPPFRAEDMEGLYKKVIKGAVPKIPSCYSKQLYDLIREMLTVNPEQRPSCDQLLANPGLQARLDKLSKVEPSMHSVMISTIKVPSNLYYLTDVLPRPNYVPRKKHDHPEKDERSMQLPSLPKLRNVSRQGRKLSKRKHDQKITESVDQESSQRHRSIENQEDLQRSRLERERQRQEKNEQELLRVRERERERRKMKEDLAKKKYEIEAVYGNKAGKQVLRVQGHRLKDEDRKYPLLLPKLKA